MKSLAIWIIRASRVMDCIHVMKRVQVGIQLYLLSFPSPTELHQGTGYEAHFSSSREIELHCCGPALKNEGQLFQHCSNRFCRFCIVHRLCFQQYYFRHELTNQLKSKTVHRMPSSVLYLHMARYGTAVQDRFWGCSFCTCSRIIA